LSIVYSGKLVLGGSGIGKTATHQVKPLVERGLLRHAFVADAKEFLEYSIRVPVIQGDYFAQDLFFDALVALLVKPARIFQGWLSQSLFTMRNCDFEIRIVNCFSAHIQEQDELLKNAYGQRLINPLTKIKALEEMKLATHILCPSEFVYKTLEKHGLAHKAKIIPFGVDIAKFHPGNKSDGVFRVLFIGRNWLRKGLLFLLEAWRQLDLNNAELLVVTSGFPKDFNLPPKTRVVDWVDDIVKTYQSADVFALPAIEDGCPLVTYEALACGLPVIVSETTGTYQHVWNGTNGFIVPTGKVSELADRIQFLYEHPKELEEMKRRARESVLNLTWEKFEIEYANWIETLLNN